MSDTPSGDATGGDVKRLRIRKYPNRRYYDSTRSRHLTLEELYSAILEGYEIEVIDSKTGQDITARVLAQMILELDPPKLGVFPVPLLHRLLRTNEQLITDFTKKYFNQALDAFLDSQRKFEQSLRSTLGLKSETPTVADWAKLMWGPFGPSGWTGNADAAASNAARAPTAERATVPGNSEPADQSAELRAVIEGLLQQVESLQKRLARQSARQKKVKRSKR